MDYFHWGGANDGMWHGPARGIALLLDKADLPPDRTRGQVRFDEVTAFYPGQTWG